MTVEASPEVLNKFLCQLKAPSKFRVKCVLFENINFCLFEKVEDVLGINQEDLENLTGNVKAVILVLPKDDIYCQLLEEKNGQKGVITVLEFI